jgi:hypothetical protein
MARATSVSGLTGQRTNVAPGSTRTGRGNAAATTNVMIDSHTAATARRVTTSGPVTRTALAKIAPRDGKARATIATSMITTPGRPPDRIAPTIGLITTVIAENGFAMRV